MITDLYTSALRKQVRVQRRAVSFAASERAQTAGFRGGIAGGATLGTVMSPMYAFAQDCINNEAQRSATDIQRLIETAANWLIYIGGAIAILMLAIGGFLVLAGGTSNRVQQGFTIVKNAFIGLAILAAGVFLRSVVLNFVGGATGGTQDCTPLSE